VNKRWVIVLENQIENLDSALKTITNVPVRYRFLNDELALTNARQTDLLHEIENSNFNAYEGYKKAKELQEIRMYRRELKNEIEIIEPLHKWCNEHKNIEVSLYKVKSSMEKIKDNKENWIYTSRVEQIKGVISNE
jgi:hypothetical protein